jgi:predicted transcriptional regulator
MPPRSENPTLGEQELELLRFVTDHAPISVRDAAIQYGEPRGLARTTVLTVMERLRKKGFLVRRRDVRNFEYTPVQGKPQVLRNLVGDFVDKMLGGSLAPFVSYLAESRDLTNDEIAELRRLLEKGETDRKGD